MYLTCKLSLCWHHFYLSTVLSQSSWWLSPRYVVSDEQNIIWKGRSRDLSRDSLKWINVQSRYDLKMTFFLFARKKWIEIRTGSTIKTPSNNRFTAGETAQQLCEAARRWLSVVDVVGCPWILVFFRLKTNNQSGLNMLELSMYRRLLSFILRISCDMGFCCEQQGSLCRDIDCPRKNRNSGDVSTAARLAVQAWGCHSWAGARAGIHEFSSGKQTKNYGTSPFSMGKSTISSAMFNSELLWKTRG